MGLDMYLYGKYFIYSFSNDKDKIKIEGLDLHGYKPKEIAIEVAYWRKANQIHNWFVKNVQDDEDDCKEYYVSREDLEILLKVCKKVLAKSKLVNGKISVGKKVTKDGWEDISENGKYVEDPSVGKDLLPTTSGFFFGNTDYDQYYIQDIQHTIESLEKALRLPNGWEFFYQSSW